MNFKCPPPPPHQPSPLHPHYQPHTRGHVVGHCRRRKLSVLFIHRNSCISFICKQLHFIHATAAFLFIQTAVNTYHVTWKTLLHSPASQPIQIPVLLNCSSSHNRHVCMGNEWNWNACFHVLLTLPPMH